MVQPQELRFGNCLNAFASNGIESFDISNGIVTGILKDAVYLNNIKFDYKSLRAIPLTEAWLLKMGFTRDPFGNFDFGLFNIDKKTFKVDWFFEGIGVEIWITLNGGLKYVHQLQNLYFDLTGEELVFIQINHGRVE